MVNGRGSTMLFSYADRMKGMNIAKTIQLAPGRYVVAVSGGVDSIALLDILAKMSKAESRKSQGDSSSFGLSDSQTFNSKPYGFVVAHFDHGIREDSHLDRLFVEQAARTYGLPYVYSEGNLGTSASEEKARDARYEFLRMVQKQAGADGIITAHHMNDVIETATHNLLRGTGRRGLSSLKSIDGIHRPLLHLPKHKLIEYAESKGLEWREDSTNNDLRYRRNYIRHQLLPAIQKKSPEKYAKLQSLIKRQADLNKAIDATLHTMLHVQPHTSTLRRYDVIALPHNVARELVGEWLRLNGKREFNSRHLERATIALKTARPKTSLILDKNYRLEFDKKLARIVVS